MGAIAYWVTRGRGVAVLWLLPLVLVTLAALALDFRIRIALALGVALVLAGGARGWMPTAWAEAPAFRKLASISYSVFLVHFPVCLMVNALWTRFLPADAWVHALGVVVAWGASVAMGALVYRHVESRGAIVLARLAAAARRVTQPARAGLAARERSNPRQRA
jgi:peptidoglycan/LPS O-acetylase OafA/YrhL